MHDGCGLLITICMHNHSLGEIFLQQDGFPPIQYITPKIELRTHLQKPYSYNYNIHVIVMLWLINNVHVQQLYTLSL